MRISHDKESGALYIKIRSGEYNHTEDFSERADVYVDVDADGNVLGLEALSFDDLAQAIEERGGKLDVPESSAAEAVAHSAARQAPSTSETAAKRAVDQILYRDYTLRDSVDTEPQAGDEVSDEEAARPTRKSR